MVVPNNDLELNGTLIRYLRKAELVAALVDYSSALGRTDLTVPVLRKTNCDKMSEARAKELADEERTYSEALNPSMAVPELKNAIRSFDL